jgi:hypothetical protein
MEVLAFAENIGCDEHAKFIVYGDLATGIVGYGAEAPSELGRVFRVAGDGCELLQTADVQLVAEVVDRVGELGKDEYLLTGVFFGEEFMQHSELFVLLGIPISGEIEDREKVFDVFLEFFGK